MIFSMCLSWGFLLRLEEAWWWLRWCGGGCDGVMVVSMVWWWLRWCGGGWGRGGSGSGLEVNEEVVLVVKANRVYRDLFFSMMVVKVVLG